MQQRQRLAAARRREKPDVPFGGADEGQLCLVETGRIARKSAIFG
jgi:hypothetical protein